MHAFSAVLSLSSFNSLFLFSQLFLFEFSPFSCFSRYPPSLYSYCSYLYWADPIEFLSFTLIAHQTFLSAVSTSLELPTNLLVARPHYIQACSLPSLSYTTHSTINSSSFGSVVSLSFFLERIRIWVSLYLSLQNASSGPNYLPPILGKDAIPAKHLPKEAMTRPFSFFHQTTPSVNPLTVSQLPLHWLGTGWWCSGHSVTVLLLFVFVFFLSHTVSTIFAHICLVLLLLLFLPVLILYVGWKWAYWAYLTFAFSWACGPTYCYFLPGWSIVPFFFPSSLSDFYGPLFLPLLTNLFYPSLFAVYWAFILLGTFYQKNRYQQTLNFYNETHNILIIISFCYLRTIPELRSLTVLCLF